MSYLLPKYENVGVLLHSNLIDIFSNSFQKQTTRLFRKVAIVAKKTE